MCTVEGEFDLCIGHVVAGIRKTAGSHRSTIQLYAVDKFAVDDNIDVVVGEVGGIGCTYYCFPNRLVHRRNIYHHRITVTQSAACFSFHVLHNHYWLIGCNALGRLGSNVLLVPGSPVEISNRSSIHKNGGGIAQRKHTVKMSIG